jgi:hypothetical protein
MSLEQLVLVPLGSELIALTREEFEQALERARTLVPQQHEKQRNSSPEPWLTAEQMQEHTGIPSTWWLESARRGDIEHYRCGKYVRFTLSSAALSLAQRPGRSERGITHPLRAKHGR